jgi:hypothetical protein
MVKRQIKDITGGHINRGVKECPAIATKIEIKGTVITQVLRLAVDWHISIWINPTPQFSLKVGS